MHSSSQLASLDNFMGFTPFRLPTACSVVLIVACAACLHEARADRVGFSYEGIVLQPPPDPIHPNLPPPTEFTLFGVTVSVGAHINGTFSYDMTAAGTTAPDGSKSFKQTIEGGFTFNVLNPDLSPRLRVSASEYSITAVDNYSQANVPGMIDYLGVDFNNKTNPPPPPLYVNDVAYISSKTTLLRVPLSWDFTTFVGIDEPRLHSELPTDALYPFIGSTRAGGTASFNVSSFLPIAPLTGDYNRDGKLDKSDRIEWRKSFNKTSPDSLYADGNANGVVDGADYVVWRNAQASLSGEAANVPEPSTPVLTAIIFLSLASFRHERFSCRDLAQR